MSDRDDVTSGGRSGNREPRRPARGGRPLGWRPSRYDVVFAAGFVSLIYGSLVQSPVISAALIGVGPVLIMTGLGLRRDDK